MKRWYAIMTFIVITGISLVIVIPALINHCVQTTIVDTFRHDYGLQDCAYVRVDPGFRSLLSGKIERVYIECEEGELNGIKAKSLIVTLRDIEFDLKKIVTDHKVVIKDIGKATARVVVDEDEVNRHVSKNYPDLKGWNLGLKPNRVVASAEIELIGKLDVAFKPRLKGDKLFLELTEARFAKVQDLGLAEAQNWIGNIGLDIPVSNLPFDMKVTRVMVQDEQLMVTARN